MMTEQQILAALEKPTCAEIIVRIISRLITAVIWCIYGLVLFAAAKWAWQFLF